MTGELSTKTILCSSRHLVYYSTLLQITLRHTCHDRAETFEGKFACFEDEKKLCIKFVKF